MREAFYNENDPHAAAWTRGLIGAGLVSPGVVDERSIVDVPADAVRLHRRAHFFAGIGGWDYALRLAGWPADRPVWTASCPCQPYSSAGKGGGDDDPRNLWPEFRRLIAECRPSTVLGEQVASKAGRLWFDGVRADLEALEYAVGAADLCAAGVGAPHIRQRLYWVADAPVDRLHEQRRDAGSQVEAGEPGRDEPLYGGPDGWLGHADGGRFLEYVQRDGHAAPNPTDRDTFRPDPDGPSPTFRLGDPHGSRKIAVGGVSGGPGIERTGSAGGLGHAPDDGRRQEREEPGRGDPRGRTQGGEQRPWDDFDVVPCRDGKARRVEPGTFPLAHGVPGRVGLLRGYGNAIVPPLAAEFIKAFLEAEHDA